MFGDRATAMSWSNVGWSNAGWSKGADKCLG